MDKIKKFLFQFDFIWSIPVAFLGFVAFPYLGEYLFGHGFGFYPPEFFHAGLYAGLVIVLFNSITQMGIYFNFPEIYEYYLGAGFENLPTWQKAVIFLFVYSFYYASLLAVWGTIV
jgi:hypothetical protein